MQVSQITMPWDEETWNGKLDQLVIPRQNCAFWVTQPDWHLGWWGRSLVDMKRECVHAQVSASDSPQVITIVRIMMVHRSGLLDSDCRLQASGFRLQASGFRLHAVGFRLQTLGFRLQASGFSPWALG